MLEEFRHHGLVVVYSSDVVSPSLRVTVEPQGTDPEHMLAQILEALGLGLEQRGEVLLVVRRAAPPAAAPAPAAGMTPVQPPRLENVVVHASRFAVRERAPAAVTFLGDNDLEQLVGAGREPLKTLGRLPGMASAGLSSKQNVRGGEEDEVLLVFDGLPLFEPFHLKDFQNLFSTLDPRVVGAMEVYTGGFPAQYGDRLSAVINVLPQPAAQQPHREIGIDFFNAGVLASGNYAGGQGDYLLSARRGTLDLLFDVVNQDIGNPSYYDFLGQLRRRVGSSLSFSGSVLAADDRITLNESDRETGAIADYRTVHAWLGLEHALDDDLSYQTILAWIDSDNRRSGAVARPDESAGFVSEWRRYRAIQLKQDWHYAPSPHFLARWGLDLRAVSARYRYKSQLEFFDDDLLAALLGAEGRDLDVSLRPEGIQAGIYFSNRWRLNPRWTAEVGMRWDRQGYTDIDNEQTSPRISVMYQPGPRTRWRLGWGRFSQAQGVHELQVEDGITDFSPAQRSYHTVAGVDHLFGNNLSLRFELYSKHMDRLRPRFENLFDQLELLPELGPDRVLVRPDSAVARGAELLIRDHREGRAVNWWAAASIASVEDTIAGREVPRSWDQPLALNAGASFRHGLWRSDVVAHYHHGWPTTPVSVVGDSPALGARNSARLPDFFSLDIRLTRRKQLSERRAWTVFLEVLNLTGRKNACCVDYSVEEGPALVREQDNWLGTVPSIGIIYEF